MDLSQRPRTAGLSGGIENRLHRSPAFAEASSVWIFGVSGIDQAVLSVFCERPYWRETCFMVCPEVTL